MIVIGNDMFVGGGGFDEMIGEGGDDIFVGSDAQDKMDGMSGFDWVTYKNDRFGVTADLDLAGTGAADGETPDHIAWRVSRRRLAHLDPGPVRRGRGPVGLGIQRHPARRQRRCGHHSQSRRRHGRRAHQCRPDRWLAGRCLAPRRDGFATGNIILGGDGSDIIEGRGGDDLIDGDTWLNVRISVRADMRTAPAPRSPASTAWSRMIPLMLDGTYNPGQLQSVREILPTAPTASTPPCSRATPADYIDHERQRHDGIVHGPRDDSVVDRDGTDTLRNIERLQFDDQSVALSGVNNDPVGRLTILDAARASPDNTPDRSGSCCAHPSPA